MVKYTATIQQVESHFRTLGIATKAPGFYNHSSFRAAENRNSEYLKNYARFVRERSYDREYLANAREEIPLITRVLHNALLQDGRKGACVDASIVLSLILERQGYWNHIVKGSLTIDFPETTNFESRHFFTFDEGEYHAAHAWVYAPPFTVIDYAVREQAYPPAEYAFIPAMVIAEKGQKAHPAPEDLIGPDLRLEMVRYGVSRNEMLDAVDPDFRQFSELFPPSKVSVGGVSLKYVPAGVSASEGSLEQQIGFSPNGRRAMELYEQIVLPALRGK